MTDKATDGTEHARNNQQYQNSINKAQQSLDLQAIATMGLFIITVFYTLYFTRALLLPIILAVLLYFLLHPLVQWLKKFYIPSQLGATLVLMVFMIIIGLCFYSLSHQAEDWMSKAPQVFNAADQKMEHLLAFMKKPLDILSRIKDQVSSLMNFAGDQEIQAVKLTPSYYLGFIFSNTWKFFIGFGMSMILLYFLLASENYYLNKIISSLSGIKQQKAAAHIVRETEEKIWNYLFARTMINVGVAIVVSIAMYFLGMPNPILWGAIAGILEFIPFLGALISISIVTMVSIVSFDSLLHIVAVPFSLFMILTLEGNFIAPYIFGRSLTLNTISVILSIFFFGWIWGILGTLIAIPMIMTIKIFLENIHPNSFISQVLSD